MQSAEPGTASTTQDQADSQHTSLQSRDLRAHKIVLPTEILKDIAAGDEGKRCLASDDADNGFFYIPDFINEAEEAYLIDKIQNAPQPKWKPLQARRLQYWGGQLSKQALIPEPLPEWLTQFPPVLDRVSSTGAFHGSKHGRFNHCLVNEYEPGQGIMPHEDGGAYYPAVATVGLGGHTLLDIYCYATDPQENGKASHGTNQDTSAADAEQQGKAEGARAREQEPRFSIVQERRSLLITKGAAYRVFLHGIAQRDHDTTHHLAGVTNGDMLADEVLREHVRAAKVSMASKAQSRDSAASATAAAAAAEGSAGQSGDSQTGGVDAGPASAPAPAPLPRTLRLSLTLRDVEKVASKSLMSMLSKR